LLSKFHFKIKIIGFTEQTLTCDMVIKICRKYSFTVEQALELRLDLEVQSAPTTDSITGPEGGQKFSARFSNKSTIFKVSLFIM